MRRISLTLMMLLVSSIASAAPADIEPGSNADQSTRLPEVIFLEGTPTSSGTDEVHMLFLQSMVMTEEKGPFDGWFSRVYQGDFRIFEYMEDQEGKAFPGEFRGEGRFLSLRTRENPDRGIVRFEGEIIIDHGLPPFDLPGYQSIVHGQSAGINPEGSPWNRLDSNAQFLGDLVGTESLSWGAVKRRFQ